jgi:hypothetical protein
MKKCLWVFGLLCILYACNKNQHQQTDQEKPLADAQLLSIKQLGFPPATARKQDSGDLVDNDIYLSKSFLADTPVQNRLRVADGEQYCTFNTLEMSRTVMVSCALMPADFVRAVDTMINRYNKLNLNLKFRRVTNDGFIDVNPNYTLRDNTPAYAGFSDGFGNPYREINISMKLYNSLSLVPWGAILQHEVGHCIGLRHTDYMDRSYNCSGSAIDEGTAGVGAVSIPGRPSNPNELSFMLSSFSGNTSMPFNENDKKALTYL